ncbi:hypothetical protein [Haloechinothrix salitolerans]|uniref:hypothetical protein n=1 Tax=Haloechinothrix salitolerans TaxID=926830 RepID=UPI0031E5BA37
MIVNEEPDFQPLSQRDTRLPQDVLFDGIPEHLMSPLTEWVTNYLHGATKLVQRVALRMRLPLETLEAHQLVDAVITRDPQELLDLVDMTIHLDLRLRWDLDVLGMEENLNEASLADWIPEWKWPKGSRTEALEQLGELLADAGSAFQINWRERCLNRRVDITVAAAAERAMTGLPGQHLRAAWKATYGRHPDPAKAYDEAIRAVEAAAIPVVLPNGTRETLGKVRSHLRDAQDKWELVIEGTNGGDAAPLVAMIELLWFGHVARHAGGPGFRPQRQDEAQMAIHLASTLVQWFTADAVRRRTQGDSGQGTETADAGPDDA